MTNARIRTPGSWTAGTTVAGAEWEAFDENQSRALDGENGGAYSLQVTLEIGGAPGVGIEFTTDYFNISGDVAITGHLSAFGDVTIGSGSGESLLVDAEANFLGEVTFNDDVAVYGDMLVGNSSSDELGVVASASFFAPVVFTDSVEHNEYVTFNSDVEFNGDIASPVGFVGTGKIMYRTFVVTDSANQTIQAALYDAIYVPTGTMDADNAYTITLGNTGIQDGMRIEIYTDDAVNGFTVLGGSLSTPIKRVAGYWQTITYERIDGVWRARGGKYES